MDATTVQTIKNYISTVGGALDATLGTVDPPLHVPIIIGTAIAQAAPDLVNDVEQWLTKAKTKEGTTPDEDAAIATKIAALFVPEGDNPNLA